MTTLLFVVAAVVAVLDWVIVWQRSFRLEYLLKPLTLLLLLAAAASADFPDGVKPWVLGALAFGVLGDIAIMVSERTERAVDPAFLLGVAAFLAGHVCYLAGFVRYGFGATYLIVGIVIAVVGAAVALPPVLRSAHRLGGDELTVAIGVYALLLGAMAAFAVGTTIALTAVGGVLFLASDSVLSRNRFVKPVPYAPLLVIVTYHLAQFLIVLGVVS